MDNIKLNDILRLDNLNNVKIRFNLMFACAYCLWLPEKDDGGSTHHDLFRTINTSLSENIIQANS